MRQDGLTLLEILICIAVLLILLTLGAPAMDEFIHKQRAESYVQQFQRHLNYARVQASSSQQPVRLCPGQIDLCQGQWQKDPLLLSLLNPLTNQAILLRELPLLPSGHQLSYNRQQLQFRRDGSLDALENGTFHYCPPGRFNWHYRIVMNQAGRNRLQRLPYAC
ncbi:GspH/FimT family pseudopilin [Alishewanella jeotgali]|nr:GspH/FimT family pseudopilin [Alishewanella jeotgali]